jgi:hypothetical protein
MWCSSRKWVGRINAILLIGLQTGTTSSACAAPQEQQQRSCCDFGTAHLYICRRSLLIAAAEALMQSAVLRSVGSRQAGLGMFARYSTFMVDE